MKKAYLTLDPPREPDGTLCRTGLRRSAPVVLLPGDPQRSRKMAALFAEASFTAHRGTFATYTGKTPGGADIAVTSSGMGCACVAAALEELAAAGAEAVIRVGTCGGVQPDLPRGPSSLPVAASAARAQAMSLCRRNSRPLQTRCSSARCAALRRSWTSPCASACTAATMRSIWSPRPPIPVCGSVC